MANIFDNLASKTFGTVAKVMGYDLLWTPSAGGEQLSARGLFRKPGENYTLGEVGDSGITYQPEQFSFEYKLGDLPGLKEAVDNRLEELVSIDGSWFSCSMVLPLSDGRHYRVIIEPAAAPEIPEPEPTPDPEPEPTPDPEPEP